METKFCCDCGTKLPASAKFCSSCGEKQISVDSKRSKSYAEETCVTAATESAPVKAALIKEKHAKPPKPVKPMKPSKLGKKWFIPLIRNSILTIIAVVMLVMAFMPVSKISLNDTMGLTSEDVPDIQMNITPVRAITIMLSSFRSQDMDDAEDELYDMLLEIQEDYEDEFKELNKDGWDELSKSDKAVITDILDTFIYEAYKVGVSVEDMSIAPQLYIAGALSLAYICAAIALLVVAILNMLSTFNIIKSEKGSLYKWTVLLLTLIPAFTVVLNYVYYITFPSAFQTSAAKSSIAGSAIAAIVISSIVIIGLFVLRIIFTKDRSVKVIVKRGVALAISIIVICLAFTPILKTSYEIIPSGSTNEREFEYSVYSPFYVYFGFLTEEEWEYADDMKNLYKNEKQEHFVDLLERMEYNSKKELTSGIGEMSNYEFISDLYFCYMGELVIIAPLLMLCQLVAVIGAGFVMWQMLRYFAIGEINRKFIISGKLVALLFGAGAVASNIILAIFAVSATNKYAPDGFSCSIALGVFFFMAFAIAMLALPVNSKRKTEENPFPVSIFCNKAVCDCDCEAVCSDAPVAEEAVEEVEEADTPVEEAPAVEESSEEAPVTEFPDDSDIDAIEDEDLQDIEDLKTLDGYEE